jgi:hypothetical protein
MPFILLLATPVLVAASPLIALIWIVRNRHLLWRYARPKLRQFLLQTDQALEDPAKRRLYFVLQTPTMAAAIGASYMGAQMGERVVSSALSTAMHQSGVAPDAAGLTLLSWPFELVAVLILCNMGVAWLFARYAGRVGRAL